MTLSAAANLERRIKKIQQERSKGASVVVANKREVLDSEAPLAVMWQHEKLAFTDTLAERLQAAGYALSTPAPLLKAPPLAAQTASRHEGDALSAPENSGQKVVPKECAAPLPAPAPRPAKPLPPTPQERARAAFVKLHFPEVRHEYVGGGKP